MEASPLLALPQLIQSLIMMMLMMVMLMPMLVVMGRLFSALAPAAQAGAECVTLDCGVTVCPYESSSVGCRSGAGLALGAPSATQVAYRSKPVGLTPLPGCRVVVDCGDSTYTLDLTAVSGGTVTVACVCRCEQASVILGYWRCYSVGAEVV